MDWELYCRKCARAFGECADCEKPSPWLPPSEFHPQTRGVFLLGMSQEELAEYLTRELADGVPVDWAAWLNEEVTVE